MQCFGHHPALLGVTAEQQHASTPGEAKVSCKQELSLATCTPWPAFWCTVRTTRLCCPCMADADKRVCVCGMHAGVVCGAAASGNYVWNDPKVIASASTQRSVLLQTSLTVASALRSGNCLNRMLQLSCSSSMRTVLLQHGQHARPLATVLLAPQQYCLLYRHARGKLAPTMTPTLHCC